MAARKTDEGVYFSGPAAQATGNNGLENTFCVGYQNRVFLQIHPHGKRGRVCKGKFYRQSMRMIVSPDVTGFF